MENNAVICPHKYLSFQSRTGEWSKSGCETFRVWINQYISWLTVIQTCIIFRFYFLMGFIITTLEAVYIFEDFRIFSWIISPSALFLKEEFRYPYLLFLYRMISVKMSATLFLY